MVCFRHAETVDGFSRDVEHELDVDATDESRGTARFRVIAVEMCGGGTGHGDHDVYPSGWRVTAVRVADKHEIIEFYQTGCFNCMVKEPEILGNVMDKTGAGFEVGLKLNADYIKYLRLKKKYEGGFDR